MVFSENINQFSSVAQSCPTLCNPIDCSTPSFPMLHHLLELAQTQDMTLKDELPRLVGAQYATGEGGRNSSRGMKGLSQSRSSAQLWLCLMVKVKFKAVNNCIA